MMDSIVLEEPSCSTAYGGGGGGPAIDRHNPIIRDGKRLVAYSTSTTATPNHHQKKKNSKETTNKNTKPPVGEYSGDQKRKSVAFVDDDQLINIENVTGPTDFISPATSSRYLLSDKAMFSFSPEFDPVLTPPLSPPPPPPHEPPKSHIVVSYAPPSPPPSLPLRFYHSKALKKKNDDLLSSCTPKPEPPPSPSPSREPIKFHNLKVLNDGSPSTPPTPPSSPPSPSPSDQVVVLEVSLHCRGCERKMRKHISKIEGVRSFKIEFAAKKVTVVGDVTPLAVLTSVLKVRNAKLLTPAKISSSPDHLSSESDYNFSEIKKQLAV